MINNDQKISEQLKDYECSGYTCDHEIGEKHYVICEKDIVRLLQSQKERVVEMIKTLPCHSEQPQGGSGGGGRQYIYLDDLKNKIEEGL